MLLSKSSSISKNKIPVFGLFLMICIVLSYGESLAQKATKKIQYPVRLANIDPPNIPLKTIIKNPNLITADPACKVIRYTIGFYPDGGNYMGPFEVTGSKLIENNINYLKEFTNMKVRIFIESIHINCNGKDSITIPLIYQSIP